MFSGIEFSLVQKTNQKESLRKKLYEVMNL